MPGIDGTWIAINDAVQRGGALGNLLADLSMQRTRSSTGSVISAPKLWFLFQQQGPAVAGTLRDDKVFTCDLKGTFAGNKLAFGWETIFSWLNVHESGSAELALSRDGAMLEGRFVSGSVSGAWRLTREAAQPAAKAMPVTSPAPPPPPVQSRPVSRPAQRRSEPPSVWHYHERVAKEIWDSDYDPALRARLLERAQVEPEVARQLARRGITARDG